MLTVQDALVISVDPNQTDLEAVIEDGVEENVAQDPDEL